MRLHRGPPVPLPVRVCPNQSADLPREARNITYSFSLKRPWAIRHVDYGLPACSHACGVTSVAVQGHHPEAVPSLLIIPLSSRVSPVLCMSHTLRDNCEPSYLHCHEQAHLLDCA